MGIQAVLKQFSGHGSQDHIILDEAELQRHQQLERLYISTKAAKVGLLPCLQYSELLYIVVALFSIDTDA